jgi:peroxiredoxin
MATFSWRSDVAARMSSLTSLTNMNAFAFQFSVPATYVIETSGCIALAFVEVDYRERLAPERIIETLRSLKNP